MSEFRSTPGHAYAKTAAWRMRLGADLRACVAGSTAVYYLKYEAICIHVRMCNIMISSVGLVN